VFRFLPSHRTNRELISIAAEVSADVIFCGVAHNMELARQLQRINRAPIVLHTEFFLDDEVFLRRRDHFGLPFLRPFFSDWTRHRLHRKANLILCSNPVEFADPRVRDFPRLSYLPWPVAGELAPRARSGRRQNQAAYVGSLSKGKGAAVLLEFFSALLERETDFQLQIVGPAIDPTGKRVLNQLREQYPGQVQLQAHCSRQEALQLLSESLFVFSPRYRFGWGLMSDAWSTGTPIIALTEHYELKDGINCLIAKTTEDFVAAACRLRDDPGAWDALEAGGLATIRGHTIDRVADTLFEALSSALPR